MGAADELLERMTRSKAGWKAGDLETLYCGFGFEKREGGSHTVYFHRKHRQLMATVTRSRQLPVGYVQCALKLISQLKCLEGGSDQ